MIYFHMPDLQLTKEPIVQFHLLEIEQMLSRNGFSLTQVKGMQVPNEVVVEDGQTNLILEEMSYDTAEKLEEHIRLYPCLPKEQRDV